MQSYYKLSELEEAALALIDLQAELSFSAIGKKLGVSKVTAANIIERLRQREIILGFSAVIDVSKIQQTAFAVFLKLRGVSGQDYAQLIKTLSDHPSIHGILECGGPHDLMFAINCSNTFELEKIVSTIYVQCPNSIFSCNISTRIAVHYYQRGYLGAGQTTPRSPKFSRSLNKPNTGYAINQIDRDIINALSSNCRITATELANSLKLSRATVAKHIENLESQKVLIGYLTRINSERFGYQIFQLLISLKNKSKANHNKLLLWANHQASVVHVAQVLAGWDFEIHLEVRNNIEMQSIIRDLWLVGGDFVSNIEVALVYKLFNKYAFKV